jgi:hypothetical protein
MAGGLFPIENPMARAMQGLGAAGGTLSQMQKSGNRTTVTKTDAPPKTAGGGLGSAASGMAMASTVGSALTAGGSTAAGSAVGGAYGMAAGAFIGLASYFLG